METSKSNNDDDNDDDNDNDDDDNGDDNDDNNDDMLLSSSIVDNNQHAINNDDHDADVDIALENGISRDDNNNEIIPHSHYSSDNNEMKLDVFPSKKKGFSLALSSVLFYDNTKRKQKVVNLSPAAFISFPIQKPDIDCMNANEHSCEEPDFVRKAFSGTSFDMNVDSTDANCDNDSGANDVDVSVPASQITAPIRHQILSSSSTNSIEDSSSCRTNTNANASSSNNTNQINQQLPQSPQPPMTLPKSDPVKLVLARVRFLLSYEKEALPAYHVFTSNSECIAVWCKTGRWSTLQASIFLHSTAAGQLKSAATLATVVGTTTVTQVVSAGGVAGWFGMTTTTTVGLLS